MCRDQAKFKVGVVGGVKGDHAENCPNILAAPRTTQHPPTNTIATPLHRAQELSDAGSFDLELRTDDLHCEDFVDDDHNYDMEELGTKRERRETDGRYADSTKPQTLF